MACQFGHMSHYFSNKTVPFGGEKKKNVSWTGISKGAHHLRVKHILLIVHILF